MANNKDFFRWGIFIFGWIEIFLGLITIIAVSLSLFLGLSTKPLGVLFFVYATSLISFLLGVGILRYKLASYRLLLFFTKMIIISKILIFLGIIHLSGALETFIPQEIKNLVSVFYHALILWYFCLPGVRKYFGERRNPYHV